MSGWFGSVGALTEAMFNPRPEPEVVAAEKQREQVPVLWLIGKVAAGKSSIVRALTGSSEAAVGDGFRPCTRSSYTFDFPAEAPMIRFLDTRGLGEAQYDPAEDLAHAEGRARIILAVCRAMDPVQEPVLAVLRAVRGRHPDWPILLAQTALHDGYPAGRGHPLPYPFDREGRPYPHAGLPEDLVRALNAQRALFERLPGNGPLFVAPIDLTQPEDGLQPAQYGLEQLVAGLTEAAPVGMRLMLREAMDAEAAPLERQTQAQVLGWAAATAAIDLVPAVGLVAVPAAQAKMLHSLAGLYGTSWDRQQYGEFIGALGTGFMLRYGSRLLVRQLTKMIPVWGQTVGAVSAAALSFASTMALGKAACLYLRQRRAGRTIDAAAIQATYNASLSEALAQARASGRSTNGKGRP